MHAFLLTRVEASVQTRPVLSEVKQHENIAAQSRRRLYRAPVLMQAYFVELRQLSKVHAWFYSTHELRVSSTSQLAGVEPFPPVRYLVL